MQRTGSLEVTENGVALEVSPSMTPQFTYTARPNGVGVGMAEDPDEMAVLGSLATSPGAVTLWGVHTTGRHSLGCPVPGISRPESHSLGADWCIAGGHFPDPAVHFHGLRVDVTNLTEWAWQPSLTELRVVGERRMTWQFDPPASLDDQLSNGEGYLALKPALNWSGPTIRGIDVNSYSELEVELFDGWTLTNCLTKVATPVASLMTLLSGATCEVRSLSVWSEEFDWSSVHGHNVVSSAPKTGAKLLLHRTDVEHGFLVRWLDLCEKISPVPQILSAVVGGQLPTVEAEALALATTIEALHRTLNPGARRFSDDDIRLSIDKLSASDLPQEVRDSLASALGTWWPEYSYPMRVRALAEPVAKAVPDCVGKLTRWKNAVVDQRVSLAHGLGSRMGRDQILRMHSLNRSIQWTLMLRLLLEAGVDPEKLRGATDSSEMFERDRDEWYRHWPKVFAS